MNREEIIANKEYLSNTSLRDANLSNANLSNANLRNANLCHANLSNANLSNANLRNANLCHANLRNANLSNAKLSENVVVYRYLTTIANIGSRQDSLLVFTQEDNTLVFKTGCFVGTEKEFIKAVKEKDITDPTRKEYLNAIRFVRSLVRK